MRCFGGSAAVSALWFCLLDLMLCFASAAVPGLGIPLFVLITVVYSLRRGMLCFGAVCGPAAVFGLAFPS
jgi:hypothetical protein